VLAAEESLPLLLRTLLDVKESIGRLLAEAAHAETNRTEVRDALRKIDGDIATLREDVGTLDKAVAQLPGRWAFWTGIATLAGLAIGLVALLWTMGTAVLDARLGELRATLPRPPAAARPAPPPDSTAPTS
jgi:hypothetical protein